MRWINKLLRLLASPHRIFITGAVIALGVIAMHHLGLHSIRMQGTLHFNIWIMTLSFIIAFVAATAGMFILFRILPYYPMSVLKVIASAIIALAVNGMHYTGMASVTYEYRKEFPPSSTYLIRGEALGEVILYCEVILHVIIEAYIQVRLDKASDMLRLQEAAALDEMGKGGLMTTGLGGIASGDITTSLAEGLASDEDETSSVDV
ncbi:hypothetical protein DFJ73DRAFT_850271 [Zopfochytrium polystomum]|nr:hypothetical protein DFJ73DRAFT_850271 [Zopfochytrium polystomum]